MSQTVAIQGYQASFHDQAARQFFGDGLEIVPCDTFTEVFTALEKSDYAVVAIENSLFGSINEVYDLVLKKHAWICGEVYLRIAQNLIGFPGTKLADITEVHSHPVALAQCEAFLNDHLPHAERFEHHDTAGSVADIKRWGDPHRAAIASAAAADLHDMAVLAEEIETNQQNYTRFVALSKSEIIDDNANKTSLVLRTHGDTKPGALYRALGVFAKRSINMSMLHSRPVIGRAWHYMFYIDLEMEYNDPEFQAALHELQHLGCEVTILGSYLSGTK